jgi:ionotropic glutamate receptor NMDA 1
VLAHALKDMMTNETITEAPKDCDDSGVFWETGRKLFHYLKSRNINGKTGRLVLISPPSPPSPLVLNCEREFI